MGSRSTRFVWPLLALLVLAMGFAPGVSHAQTLLTEPTLAPQPDCIPPPNGTPANFGIDGFLICGVAPASTAEDWFSLGAGCTGVLLNTGAANPLRLPALFERDSTSNSIGPYATDLNVFKGNSNKNSDLIDDSGLTGHSPWQWVTGSTPPKDDLSEVYLHARTDMNGHLWIILGNAYVSTDGDKHVDYEFNIAGIRQTGSVPDGGQLIGNGPDGGRTTDKDFVISLDYVNGGVQACVSLRTWKGTFYDSLGIPAGSSYSAVNQVSVDVPVDVMSTLSQYRPTRHYEPHQFAEAGIDITALLPNIQPSDLCKPTATVLVKTRSSQSFTAELKDFALIHFNIVSPPSVSASNTGPACVGGSITLSATVDPLGGTFAWTGPNGFSSTDPSPVLSPLTSAMAGWYRLTYTTPDGCLNVDSTEVVVNTSSVTAGNDGPKCVGGTLGLTATGTPPGGTYAWTGPNGFTSSLQNPSITNVQLAAGGTYTVTYTSTDGCQATNTTTVTINSASVTAGNDGPKCVGATLSLTAAGTPPGGSYVWSGPNSFTSNLQNPTITNVQLVAAGTYTVTYTSLAGCSNTATTTVTINTASVTAGNDGPQCVGGTLGLTASGTPPGGTYQWTGPNGFTSNLQNPTISSVQLAAGGTYTVTYTSSAGCLATNTTTVTINSASVTAGNDGPKCKGSTINLTATGTPPGGTYAWTGPNGFSSNLQNPTVANAQLVSAGTYTVTYTSPQGCSNTGTTNVVINQSTVSASNGGPVCVGQQLCLTANGTPSGGTYVWSGPNGFTSTEQNPCISNAQLAAGGTYTVTYTSPDGCVSSNTTTATVGAASVTAGNDGPKCTGFTLGLTSAGTPPGGTYAWTGPNGFTSNLQNPSIPNVTLAAAGTYTVTYTSPAGCVGTNSTNVTINTASVTASNDGPKCTGFTLTLSSAGTPPGGTYQWTGPNGFTSNLQNPTIPNVTMAANGTYTVTYTSAAGCVASNTTNVTINTATVTNGNGGPVCVGQTLNLTSNGTPAGGTFAWTGPNGFTSSDQNPSIPDAQLVNAGNYIVTYTTVAGCIAKDTTTAVVNAASVLAGNDGPKCVGQEVCLSAAGTPAGGSYSWTGPDGFTSTDQNPCIPALTAAKAGDYIVTYTAGTGCIGKDTTTVVVNPLPTCSLTAPEPLPQCASPGNQLCAGNLTNVATYLWTVTSTDDSWQITGGAATECVTYTAGNGGTEGTFKLVVTSEAGCKDSCTVTFGCRSTQLFCTLTQGAYGNANGMFQGMRRLELIQSLLSMGDLVIGKTTAQSTPTVVAARSVTFDLADAQCIIDRLPAGGTPTALPAALGNFQIVNCNTGILPTFNGKFRNVFLGQLITLSLNARLGEADLGGMTICKTMKSVRAITGPDGKPMPDPTDTGKMISISSRVITALANLGLPKTVGGLIELANRAIAGQFTDVATLSDIAGACGAINDGFDECRFLVQCLDGETGPIAVGGSGEVLDESVALPREFAISGSAPNPFNHLTTLRLSLPERSSVQLSVYNILGQEIARIADGEFGAGVQTVQWNAASRRGDPVAPGVYFFRVKANGLESGRQFTRTQKVLYIR